MPLGTHEIYPRVSISLINVASSVRCNHPSHYNHGAHPLFPSVTFWRSVHTPSPFTLSVSGCLTRKKKLAGVGIRTQDGYRFGGDIRQQRPVSFSSIFRRARVPSAFVQQASIESVVEEDIGPEYEDSPFSLFVRFGGGRGGVWFRYKGHVRIQNTPVGR